MTSATRRLCRVLVSSIVTGAAVVVCHPLLASADPADTPAATASQAAPAGRAGQMIHADPATGARTAGPVNPDEAAAALTNNPALSTSQEGLHEEPAPGGGVMIDLQGRFRSAAEATIGADGKPHVNCHSPGVPGGEQ